MKARAKTNNQSLLTDAFGALLERLGPQKTLQVWRTLVPFSLDYLKGRKEMFKGRTLASVFKESRKFNR